MKFKQNDKKEQQNGNISTEISKLLIEQISHELYNHNLYKTFANYYGVKGYTVIEKYYNERAAEEYNHHQWICDYLNTQDVCFNYPAVEPIDIVLDNMIESFDITIDVEKETTMLINNIVDKSLELKDYATFNWLNLKGMLVNEQIEEESISRTVADIAKMEGSWLRKEKSIEAAYNDSTDDDQDEVSS